jgi:hypothetical protein
MTGEVTGAVADGVAASPRAYRWGLLAYPRWYRRERGLEMLTTLADAGPRDQGRARPRDVVDLLVGGVRCRLRPPRGFWWRAVVVVVALFAGLAGTSAVQVLWPRGAPSAVEATRAAAVVIPAPPERVEPARRCVECTDWDDGPLDRADFVDVLYRPPVSEVPGWMTAARERLAAAGWRVGEIRNDEGDLRLRASRGGLTLSLTGTPYQSYVDKDLSRPNRTDPTVRVIATRSLSAGAVAASGGGFLGGVLAGWLVAAWATQRFRRQRRLIRLATLAGAAPGLGVALLWDLLSVDYVFSVSVVGTWSPNHLWLPALWARESPTPLFVAAGSALLTVALAALSTRGDARPRPTAPAT